jgi:hypothetical protein
MRFMWERGGRRFANRLILECERLDSDPNVDAIVIGYGGGKDETYRDAFFGSSGDALRRLDTPTYVAFGHANLWLNISSDVDSSFGTPMVSEFTTPTAAASVCELEVVQGYFRMKDEAYDIVDRLGGRPSALATALKRLTELRSNLKRVSDEERRKLSQHRTR